MSDTTPSDQLGTATSAAGLDGRERQYARALMAGLFLRLALELGLGGLFGKPGSFVVTAINLVPWALLLAATAFLMAYLGLGKAGLGLSANRLRGHVTGWGTAAVVMAVMAVLGTQIEPVLGFLGKSAGILVDFCQRNGLFLASVMALMAAGLAAVGNSDISNARPGRVEQMWVHNFAAKFAGVPMILTALGIFVGCTIWTVVHSFTNSKLLPKLEFVGLDQYERLWSQNRWLISIENLAIYGICSMIFSLTIGFILAAMLDQKIRFENTFRSIFLFPFALSFIVTGLVWQWILNPEFGVQQIVRDLGFEAFVFDPLYNADIVIYGVLIAGLWQGTGLIMCLMLAGLRGIDEDIWKAARVDGIPMWKTYVFIVIPMMRPVFITTLVIIASGIVRVYDLVVAQTNGGPGIASEVPAKYVYDYMFQNQNLGQGFAASTMMLLSVLVIVVPWAMLEFRERKHG
jgi:glucose/mannose transport system permease protein